MAGKLVCGTILLLGMATVVTVRGQYDDYDFGNMGYDDDIYGGYGGMGGMGGMMGGMGGMGGYGGYGGYGGDPGPSHTVLNDMAEVEKFMHEDPESPSVIGYFNEDVNSADIAAFATTATVMAQMGVRFGLATEDDVLETLKYKNGRVMAYPATRFMAEGDRAKARFPGTSVEPESLQIWVSKAATPVVGLYTWEAGARYQEIGLPELVVYGEVDITANPKSYDELAATLRKVASARPSKELSYAVGDYAFLSNLVSRFKFPELEKDPELRGASVGIRHENSFYRMDGEFSEEAVVKFIEEYVAGSLKPVHVEEPAEDNYGSPQDDEEEEEADSDVVVLSMSNFVDVVMEDDKDVFVEFYAPWCGHCKELKPVYDELAAELLDTPSVVVAKMNADKHTPPDGFPVQSYPTIMFVKAADKSNPIKYEGARDKASMLKFVRENLSTPAVSA